VGLPLRIVGILCYPPPPRSISAGIRGINIDLIAGFSRLGRDLLPCDARTLRGIRHAY